MTERPSRPALGRNVVANVAWVVTFIATAGLSVPFILDHVGLAGYGVWTIGMTVILYVTTAEAGIGPSVQRFSAVAHGAGDTDTVGRLLWTSLALYCVIGTTVAALAYVLAPHLVDLFDVPSELRQDARDMFRLTGLVMLVALLEVALGNVQQGLERYVAFSVAAVLSSLVYLSTLVVLLSAGHGLPGLAWAAVAQQATLFVIRAWSLRDVIAANHPRLLARRATGEVVRFSARLQVTVLSLLVNSQTDKVVVGLIAPASTVGQLGIGSQVAEAGRSLAIGALAPINSRLARARGEGGEEPLLALFTRINRLWLLGVVGGTAIGVGTVLPLIDGWLGEGHAKAAVFGGCLILAYGTGMLPGSGMAYLRAVGRPGLEARFGGVLIALNVVLTVAFGLTYGPVAVVVATTVAYLLGTAWFLRRLPDVAPELPASLIAPLFRGLPIALLGGGLSLAWGLAMTSLLPDGVSLVPVAGGAAVAFIGYMSLATGVAPTRENVRALLA